MLLRLWLWLQGRRLGLDLDLPFLNFDLSGPSPSGGNAYFGGGGSFSGGGASGSWGKSIASSLTSGESSASPGFDIDLDLEEGWLIILALIALAGGLIASFYVIYIAPALLADILVDGVLVAGLYARVKRIEQRHWLRAAFRHTWLPAALAAILFTFAGYLLQKAVPEAHSIGDIWRYVRGI